MNTSTTLQNAQNQKGSQYEVGVKKLYKCSTVICVDAKSEI